VRRLRRVGRGGFFSADGRPIQNLSHPSGLSTALKQNKKSREELFVQINETRERKKKYGQSISFFPLADWNLGRGAMRGWEPEFENAPPSKDRNPPHQSNDELCHDDGAKGGCQKATSALKSDLDDLVKLRKYVSLLLSLGSNGPTVF